MSTIFWLYSRERVECRWELDKVEKRLQDQNSVVWIQSVLLLVQRSGVEVDVQVEFVESFDTVSTFFQYRAQMGCVPGVVVL